MHLYRPPGIWPMISYLVKTRLARSYQITKDYAMRLGSVHRLQPPCTIHRHRCIKSIHGATTNMLLLQTSNVCKVGDICRYTITYTPQPDRAQLPPVALYLRIKNTALLPLRAAYLHGPYTLYVSVRRKEFQPWPSRSPGTQSREEELRSEEDRGGIGEGGIPEFVFASPPPVPAMFYE